MIDYWDYYLFGYESPYGGQGMATTLPAEKSSEDRVADLHKVIEEITGKPVDPPSPRRIGFV